MSLETPNERAAPVATDPAHVQVIKRAVLFLLGPVGILELFHAVQNYVHRC